MAFQINFESDIIVNVCGISVAVQDVVVEFDSDGDVSEITADGKIISAYANDPGIRALHTEICAALNAPGFVSWIEERHAEWLADEPNRRADYQRERSY